MIRTQLFAGVCVCAYVCTWPAAVLAQSPALPGRFEAAAGIRRIGPTALGTSDADLTTPDGGTSALFSTDTDLGAALAVEGRIGMALTSTLQLEGSFSWGQSDLSTQITADDEGLDDVTATEPVQQLTLDAGLIANLTGLRLGARALPFVSAGAGYLRDLHESRSLVETGWMFYFGGGLNLWFSERPAATMKAMGLRVDARATFRIGGVAFDDDPVIAPAFGASLFFRF